MMEEDNDIENLFEFDNDAENEPNNDETGNENPANPSAPEGTTVAPSKRVVRNPRLKFNADRLIGERGIPVLIDHFKDVKFKGKGHEERDLDKLLATLELWTHRLFPSMKLEDNLKQIEKLGHKRPVQTCVQKIRMDMPLHFGNTVNDEEDNVRRNEDFEADLDPDDAFDQLLGHQDEPVPEEDTEILTSQVANVDVPSTSGYILGHSKDTGLTEEQRKRMEYNRSLAAERRKMASFAQSLNSSVLESTALESATSQIEAPVASTSSLDLNGCASPLMQSNHHSDFSNYSLLEPTETHSGSNDLQISERSNSNSRAYDSPSVQQTSSYNAVTDEYEQSTSSRPEGASRTNDTAVDNLSSNSNYSVANNEPTESTSTETESSSVGIHSQSKNGDVSLDDALNMLDDDDDDEEEFAVKKRKVNRRISSDEEMDE